ncbi:galactose-1-phosphate uridylyltransferase, partial [Lachnotalea glycerini]
MINRYIKKLVSYGIETGLLKTEDKIYATNQLLEILRLNEYEEPEKEYTDIDLEEVLKAICNYAFEQKIIDDNGTATRDLFETKLMNVLLPRPSEVIHKFQTCYKDSPKKATDYFYQFSQDSNYIRRYRVSKDIKWVANTRYGDLDITINLSKPEKDPKAMAAAKKAKQGGNPKG